MYWFPDVSSSLPDQHPSKALWFVSDVDKRDKLDKEITERFGKVLLTLENENERKKINLSSIDSVLAAIIILDQFSRHIYRNSGQQDRIDRNTKYASELTEIGIKNNYHHMLSGAKLSFFLMPYRHLRPKSAERLLLVDQITQEAINSSTLDFDVLKRFKKATENELMHAESSNSSSNNNNGDENVQASPYSDILEFFPDEKLFDGSQTKSILRNVLCSTMKEFVKEQLQTVSSKYLIVSLSGGVDSMVIATVLKYLFPQTEVIAIHVNYGNRTEAFKEAAFLREWCGNMKITFKELIMDSSLRRGVTPRDDYERITREKRFDMYRTIVAESGESKLGVMLGHHRGDVQENVVSNTMKGAGILRLSGMERSSLNDGVYIWRPFLPHDKSDIFDFAHAFGVPYFKDSTPDWSTRGKLRRKLLPTIEDVYGPGFKIHLSSLAAQSDELKVLVESTIFSPFFTNRIRHLPMVVVIDCLGYEAYTLFFWKHILREIAHKMGIGTPSEASVLFLVDRFTRIAKAREYSRMQGEEVLHTSQVKNTKVKYKQLAVIDDTFRDSPSSPYTTTHLKLHKSCLVTIVNNRFILWFRPGIPESIFEASKDTQQTYKTDVDYIVGPWRIRIDSNEIKCEENEAMKSVLNEKNEQYKDDWQFLTSNKFRFKVRKADEYKLMNDEEKGLDKQIRKWDPVIRLIAPLVVPINNIQEDFNTLLIELVSNPIIHHSSNEMVIENGNNINNGGDEERD